MIKKATLFLMGLFLFSSCYATWQIAGAPIRTPGNQPNKIIDNTPPNYIANPSYNLETHPGSLHNTIVEYASQHNWQVVWKAKHKNYSINVRSIIGGTSVQQVLNRLLAYYPLHASYNKQHKVITILSN